MFLSVFLEPFHADDPKTPKIYCGGVFIGCTVCDFDPVGKHILNSDYISRLSINSFG